MVATASAQVRVAATVGALGLAAPAAYTVQPGDTLSEIAHGQGVSMSALASANGIDDADHIVAGTELKLPDVSSEPTPVGTADVEALLTQAAQRHGWSPRFVKAIAYQESGWDQSQVSHAGAIGIMQVMPGTGEFVADHLVGRELDLRDPYDNVEAGVVFLQHLWELTGGDVEMTLAGYYQGLRSVRENGLYDDTEQYLANVLALRDRF